MDFGKFRDHIVRKIIPAKVHVQQHEANFLEKYRGFTDEEKEIIEKAKANMDTPMYASMCIGLMMIVSLRRYVKSFRNISVLRCLSEVFAMSVPVGYMYINIGVPLYLRDINEVRINLIMRNDIKYFEMMKWLWTNFPEYYKVELNMFREIMKKEKFLEWYEDVPQYEFDVGQEPDLNKIKNTDINMGDFPFEIAERDEKNRQLRNMENPAGVKKGDDSEN